MISQHRYFKKYSQTFISWCQRNYPRMRSFDFSQCYALKTPILTELLGGFVDCRVLISKCFEVTEDVLVLIRNCKFLAVSDLCIKHLPPIPHPETTIQTLILTNSTFSVSALQSLLTSQLDSLVFLGLGGCRIEESQVEVIPGTRPFLISTTSTMYMNHTFSYVF